MEKSKYVRLGIVLLVALSCLWVGVAFGVPDRSSKRRVVTPDTQQYLDATDVKVIGFSKGGVCRAFVPDDRPVSAYVSYADCDHVVVEYYRVVVVPGGITPPESHSLEPEPKQ